MAGKAATFGQIAIGEAFSFRGIVRIKTKKTPPPFQSNAVGVTGKKKQRYMFIPSCPVERVPAV